jgi:hypothetical protein
MSADAMPVSDAEPADGPSTGGDGGAPDGGLDDAALADDGGRGDAGDDAGEEDGGEVRDDGGGPGGADGAVADGGGSCSPTSGLASRLGEAVYRGSTMGAGRALTPTCASGSTAGEVLLSWTAPETGTYTFDTAGSTYDTVLELREVDCRPLPVACDDDSGPGTTSRVTIALEAGREIVVHVDGFGDREGEFVLSILRDVPDRETVCDDGLDEDRDGEADCGDSDCGSDPACEETVCDDGRDDDGDGFVDCEDFDCDGAPACAEHLCSDGRDDDGDRDVDCADFDCIDDAACTGCTITDLARAVGLAVFRADVPLGATRSVEGTCGGRGTEYALLWTAPATGVYVVDTDGSDVDTVLYALDGSDCAAPELECNDDVGPGVYSSEVRLSMTEGRSVLLVVDTYSDREAGAVVLNIRRE